MIELRTPDDEIADAALRVQVMAHAAERPAAVYWVGGSIGCGNTFALWTESNRAFCGWVHRQAGGRG